MPKAHFILMVDDSDDDAFFFERAVKRVDAEIRTHRVNDGQEAIDYLLGAGEFSDRSRFPMPHVITVDLKMPICDGFDFLAWKQGQLSLVCIPAIVMSSSRLESDIRRSYELGAHSFTTKVLDVKSLTERISALRDWWFHNCVLPLAT